MLDYLYEDIGYKIKVLAKCTFVVEAFAAIITGLYLWVTSESQVDILISLLVLFAGPIVALVSSWGLYAFGQIVEDVNNFKNEGRGVNNKTSQSPKGMSKFNEVTKKQNKILNETNSKKHQEIDENVLQDDDFVEILCPNCSESLSFLKEVNNAICPWCNTKINLH